MCISIVPQSFFLGLTYYRKVAVYAQREKNKMFIRFGCFNCKIKEETKYPSLRKQSTV
jgi:hypothetical protein